MATFRCFDCGEEGHIAANCPNRGLDSCGRCDPRTHLVTTPDGPKRCPRCHPKASELRRPLKRCGACQHVIYEWDNEPCGHHQAPRSPDQRLTQDQINAIMEGK